MGEAAVEARKHINFATEVDPSNPEGWQALASFLLVLGESEEAGVAMERSLSLWLPQHTAWAATGEGEQTNLSYDTRLASVKVLLDLEQFDKAAEIPDSLLEEDNEVVAAWYLHGWLNYLRNDPDFHGNVRHYLKRAQQVHVMSPTDDEAMMEHIKELLTEVGEEESEEAVEEGGSNPLEYTERTWRGLRRLQRSWTLMAPERRMKMNLWRVDRVFPPTKFMLPRNLAVIFSIF